MQAILGLFSGSSIGYFTAKLLSGEATGELGLIGSRIFQIGDWQLHLHHWLVAFILLGVSFLFFRNRYRLNSLFCTFFFGVLIGLIVQGIFTYDDWYQVLIKNIN